MNPYHKTSMTYPCIDMYKLPDYKFKYQRLQLHKLTHYLQPLILMLFRLRIYQVNFNYNLNYMNLSEHRNSLQS